MSTLKTNVVFYLNPMGNLTQALAALVREPYGCFEVPSAQSLSPFLVFRLLEFNSRFYVDHFETRAANVVGGLPDDHGPAVFPVPPGRRRQGRGAGAQAPRHLLQASHRLRGTITAGSASRVCTYSKGKRLLCHHRSRREASSAADSTGSASLPPASPSRTTTRSRALGLARLADFFTLRVYQGVRSTGVQRHEPGAPRGASAH